MPSTHAPFRRSAALVLSLAAGVGAGAGGCSLRPSYEVRVVNQSSATVVALIRRDRTLDDDEVLAQARIKPAGEALLGPASADPLDPVELLVSRPEDLQTLPDVLRLSRGRWTATVTDAPLTTWNRFEVRLTKD